MARSTRADSRIPDLSPDRLEYLRELPIGITTRSPVSSLFGRITTSPGSGNTGSSSTAHASPHRSALKASLLPPVYSPPLPPFTNSDQVDTYLARRVLLQEYQPTSPFLKSEGVGHDCVAITQALLASMPPIEPPSQLVWNTENIRDVAESVGISSLNAEAVRSLAQEVEYRVGQVTAEAMRFMQMGKRTVLGTQDIAQALKVLDVEPLYGYESTRPLRFGEASLGPGQPLFYIEDEEVDFEKLINAPLPKVPRDISMTSHWLGVEGVQPSIPQNPTTAEARAAELIPKGPGANQNLGALAGNDNVSLKPQVKHIISKELVMYFDKVVAAIINDQSDEETIAMRTAAFASVREESGIHQLIPYFDQYISHKVTTCLNDLFVLKQMMLLLDAMIGNKNLFLDPYMASLVPPVLTCIIAHKLGTDDPEEVQKQYELRDLAASLAGAMTRNIRDATNQTKIRFVRTLLKHFLDMDFSLATHYGALKGISRMVGAEGVRRLVVHVIKPYEYMITRVAKKKGEDAVEIQMIIAAIVESLSLIETPNEALLVNGDPDVDQDGLYEALGPVIGSRIARKNNQVLNKLIVNAIRDEKRLKADKEEQRRLREEQQKE